MTPPPAIGAESIRAALAELPHAPGIYQMIDKAGTILYIGKAKNLAHRVASYTHLGNLNTRQLRMVSQVAQVSVVLTKNEAEALLTEARLVKHHQPRYNVLLKDDKRFPQLRIDTSHPFPRIEKYRGSTDKPGEYFGPFANVGALNETMSLLQKIFLLRPCSDSMFTHRTRPCLQYQIKRCSAPCVGYVTPEQYGEQIARARAFLKGRHREVQDMLVQEMETASAAMAYEKAASLRDHIRALTQVQQQQGLRIAGLDDADLIVLARRGAVSVVMVRCYRSGAYLGQHAFHPRHGEEESDAEIVSAFLAQFYQTHLPPEEIFLSAPVADTHVLEQALRAHVHVPQRGDKRALVTEAEQQAAIALLQRETERISIAQHLTRLQELFQLEAPPNRIEVYDNSHISGTHAVGAFIVATPHGFDKKSYRNFSIKEATPGDDYAMMREVFRRRFSASSDSANKPDLILIDGGMGQLHAVEEALASIGATGLKLVAIAKGEDRNAGREWFHQPGREAFQLPVNDPTLHYLQRLRDEAHRFAIGRHRGKRSKSLTHSTLDDIPGIGATRKRALLQHFGSRSDVATATLEELTNVRGISTAIAKTIYDYFRD